MCRVCVYVRAYVRCMCVFVECINACVQVQCVRVRVCERAVCVRERERERECVCVYVRVRVCLSLWIDRLLARSLSLHVCEVLVDVKTWPMASSLTLTALLEGR